MKTLTLTRSRRFAKAGFSLIEVVLAVGIMALGVVTILGLLPHGLEVSRKTANEMAESRIIDTIVSDLQAMDWVTLDQATGKVPYNKPLTFDDQGLVITNAQEALYNQSYLAKVEIPEPNVVLPTNQATPAQNMNLRRVVIHVVATPIPADNFNFTTPPAGATPRTYTQLVARTR